MANTIALISSKGGSGKTTVALNLAVALAERGRQTLLVDLDPQGCIGLALARSDTEWSGVAEMLIGQGVLDGSAVQTKVPSLSILSRGRLDPCDIPDFEQALYGGDALRGILANAVQRFDHVVIDTPSGLGLVPRAVLGAAHFVLVPLQAEPLALRSLTRTLRVIEHVQERINPSLRLLGILPTMVSLSNATSLKVMTSTWSSLAGVLESYIPRADVFGRASDQGIPVGFLGGRPAPEARRFEALAAEIESLLIEASGQHGEADERPQRTLV